MFVKIKKVKSTHYKKQILKFEKITLRGKKVRKMKKNSQCCKQTNKRSNKHTQSKLNLKAVQVK
jgi:hypothetical protein